MNIVLINHYAGSTQHGMEFRPFYLAREWVKSGHDVHIIAASYSHVRTVQPIFDGKKFIEDIEGIEYHWYKTPKYIGNGIGRIKNILSFLWALWTDSKEISKSMKPDVVIASSTYPMDIWIAKRIADLSGARLIYEVHDLWPLSPMELGGMSRWHPFILWVQAAEDFAYKHVDHVISMVPKALDYMISRGLKPEKFIHIPNGISPEEWDQKSTLPDEVNSQIDKIRSKGKPVVGYSGTHGLANALDTLLDAAKLIKDRVEIIMVGNGPERNRLMKRAIDEELSNITFIPSIPKQSIPAFLKKIDIAYIGWHPNPMYRFGISPNKIMDYMMAGKAIVHSVSAGNDPVAENACGISVPPNSPKDAAEAILSICALSNEQRVKIGNAGRQFVLNSQTYPILAKRFLDMVKMEQENS